MSRLPCWCPSEGHKHGVSIQSSINLGDTFLRIACKWKTAETWFLEKLFILQSSIISQILEFFYWMVTIFILITWLVKTENSFIANIGYHAYHSQSSSLLIWFLCYFASVLLRLSVLCNYLKFKKYTLELNNNWMYGKDLQNDQCIQLLRNIQWNFINSNIFNC